jgi:hypothetical protein
MVLKRLPLGSMVDFPRLVSVFGSALTPIGTSRISSFVGLDFLRDGREELDRLFALADLTAKSLPFAEAGDTTSDVALRGSESRR